MHLRKSIVRVRFVVDLAVLVSVVTLSWPLPAKAENLAAFDTDSNNHLGLIFSPDGKTAVWAERGGKWGISNDYPSTLYLSSLSGGTWSTPTIATFSGTYSDDDPFVSPDGSWLYFTSDRPTGTEDETRDVNIWRFSLDGKNQLEPLSVNSDSAEYSPVVSSSGAIFFASNRKGGQGQGDLYRAEAVGLGFKKPVPLGPAFNTPTGEWNLWVSPDESEIIFEASSRRTNVSIPGDLYYSWLTPAGWTSAVPIRGVNSADSDLLPRLHPDGKRLYYTSAPIGGHARIVTADWVKLRAAARSAYAPILMVANRSSHEVTFVDLSRGTVRARLASGDGPHLLSNVSDGRVLATGYGQFPKPHTTPVASRPPFVTALNSRVSFIDTVEWYIVWDIEIEDCTKPHASWIVGDRGYVTCEEEGYVQVLDLQNGHAVARLDTLQQGSHVLSFEPQSQTLAVSNTESGSATLIDIETRQSTVVMLAAGSEGALAVDGRIWVGNAEDGSISVIDPNEATEIERIGSVCQFPIALSEDMGGQVWVACFASAELVAIDPKSFAILRRIDLEERPLNLIAHPDRNLAYVSLPRQNAIAEIDLESGRELRRINVGMEPDGLRWAAGQR